jgi:hypothetical protein
MANETTKKQLKEFLLKLVMEYEKLEKERLYLVNEAQARVQAIQAEKQELQAEAQESLTRLNVLLAADEQDQITLQELRNYAQSRINRPA